MADSLEFQVFENLQTVLRAITVAGGYSYDVDSEAVSLDPDQFTPGILLGELLYDPFFLILGESARDPQRYPAMQILEQIPGTILAATDVDQLDPLAKLRAIQQLYADIETAIVLDITRGGLATDTLIGDKQSDTPTGSTRVLVIVPFVIRLHRTEGQPNG